MNIPITKPRVLAAMLAIALSSGLMATNADAAEKGRHPSENESISVKGGYVEFHHYGEIVEVSDEVLDGRGMQALILSGGEEGRLSDFTADGDPERLNLSLPEGRGVSLQLCYTVEHQPVECSRWQVGYA